MALSIVSAVACAKSYGDSEDPAPAGDAGSEKDAGDPDGSTPGTISCGTLVCDLATSFCCVGGTPGSVTFRCTTDAQCTDNPSHCDDAADCASGEKCCATLSSSSFSTVCQKSCTVAQSCRVDSECGNAKCVKQRCAGEISYLCGQNFFCEPL